MRNVLALMVAFLALQGAGVPKENYPPKNPKGMNGPKEFPAKK